MIVDLTTIGNGLSIDGPESHSIALDPCNNDLPRVSVGCPSNANDHKNYESSLCGKG